LDDEDDGNLNRILSSVNKEEKTNSLHLLRFVADECV
jgi:hypothetical protein